MYMYHTIIPALFKHKDVGPFKEPVNPVKLNIPVSTYTQIQIQSSLRWLIQV